MQPLGTNPVETGGRPTPHSDRRRRVRHKVHTPAYTSLNVPSGGRALDLSEIVDISEDGMAIQSSVLLEVGGDQDFALDLSEAPACIDIIGRVIWSDESGRAGIQFEGILPEANYALKRWLFANAIAACVNYEVEAQLATESAQKAPGVRTSFAAAEDFETTVQADYTSLLSALDAVRREVESLGADLDAALHLIARRAQAFTRASGTAVALTEGENMVCRATAGPDAPPLGARLQAGEGFSGACVRAAILLRCEDSEIDPRVDRESCRALGIRSMVAAPVLQDAAVIGLLEVFSPQPQAFGPDDEIVLRRLTEIVAAAVRRFGSVKPGSQPLASVVVDDEFPVETPADLPLPRLSKSRNVVLLGAAATVALVIVRLVGPWDGSRAPSAGFTSVAQESPKVAQSTVVPPGTAENLDALRKRADQGDPGAQFLLGVRYHTGDEVQQDYAQAFRWFSLAAEQGNVSAQATLGAYYWAGRGVAPDSVEAYFWSLLAESGGDEASKLRVALLATRLKASQIAVAQQRAKDWLKQHQLASNALPAAP